MALEFNPRIKKNELLFKAGKNHPDIILSEEDFLILLTATRYEVTPFVEERIRFLIEVAESRGKSLCDYASKKKWIEDEGS